MPIKDPQKRLEYERKRRAANPEKHRLDNARWRRDNPAKIRASTARWQKANPEKTRESNARWRATHPRADTERYRTNLQYRLRKLIRARLRKALANGTKSGSAVKLLGCTVDELRVYLEVRWTVGMSWETQGRKGWHIDHIVPLTAFDLTNSEQLAKACHYTNLQPLWWQNNLEKGAQIL